MKNFQDRLRALREGNDLTQQVAKVLETSQTMYAKYERGANEMTIHHLKRICIFYNVSAGFLLGLEPDRSRERGAAERGRVFNRTAEKTVNSAYTAA